MTFIQEADKKALALFDTLPPDILIKLESQLKEFVFKKKQIIHRAGLLPTGLFIIRKGKVKIYHISDSAREIIIHIAGPGEMVGYNALMRKSEYHFWAEAIEPAELSFLPQNYFYDFIENYPVFSVHMMQEFARQFDAVMDKMVDMLSDHVRKRTAKTLLWLKDTHGFDDDGRTIAISLSRQDLAHLVATNTETLVRTLTEFRKENVIELKRKKITITDLEQLNRIAKTS
jgi:CRP-like cAMP-binding protein